MEEKRLGEYQTKHGLGRDKKWFDCTKHCESCVAVCFEREPKVETKTTNRLI